jgi:hypothetical protein
MSSISDDMTSMSDRNTTTAVQPVTSASAIKTILLLTGAFTFSFLLGEAVHEFGHYLAHVIYGNGNAQVYLDPFGGSRIAGVTGFTTPTIGAVTAAAGPLFNLFLASAFFFLMRRRRNTWLLPLMMWGPIAMIQEGVNFSIGLLTSGGDGQWIVSTGLPVHLLVIFGVFLFLLGASLITLLLPLASIHPSSPILQKYSLITIGFCSLMGIRLIHSLFTPGQQLIENLVPFVFSILLSSVVTLLSCKIKQPIKNRTKKSPQPISWNAALAILSAGFVMFILQIFIGKI